MTAPLAELMAVGESRIDPERADAGLIGRCLEGDDDAWERLVQRYSSLVYSVARRYRLDEGEAGDVFQAVWLAVWEGLGSMREVGKLSSWLITVTARTAWHTVRARGRHISVPLEDVPELPEREWNQPEEEALRGERKDTLRRAMARLPERSQRLLWSLYYDPTAPSYAEVARRLGMPEGSIGPTRGRCLEQLRRALQAIEGAA